MRRFLFFLSLAIIEAVDSRGGGRRVERNALSRKMPVFRLRIAVEHLEDWRGKSLPEIFPHKFLVCFDLTKCPFGALMRYRIDKRASGTQYRGGVLQKISRGGESREAIK